MERKILKVKAQTINDVQKVNAYADKSSIYEQQALAHSNTAKQWAEKSEQYAINSENSAVRAEEVLEQIENNENISTVINNIEIINFVSENIEGINTTAENIEAINTVFDNTENITTIINNLTNINNVANNLEDIQTVEENKNIVLSQVSVAVEQANIAKESAEVATEQTAIATSQAGVATVQAQNSEHSANLAYQYSQTAKEQAESITNSADIVETQANIATEQSALALGYSKNAKTSEENAKISETNAKTSEQNAKTSETKAKEYYEQTSELINNADEILNDINKNIDVISSVENNLEDINSVVNHLEDINSVSENLEDISSIAENLEDIQQAENYYNLSKQWAISETIVDKTDYSSKYYANKSESYSNSSFSSSQTALSYAQMANSQNTQATASATQAKKYADEAKSYLEQITEQGSGTGVPIGAYVPLPNNIEYVPEGLLYCDGAEYTKSQFNDFYDNYLKKTSTSLEFCTINNNTIVDGKISNFNSPITINLIKPKLLTIQITLVTSDDITTKQLIFAGITNNTVLYIENGNLYSEQGLLGEVQANTMYHLYFVQSDEFELENPPKHIFIMNAETGDMHWLEAWDINYQYDIVKTENSAFSQYGDFLGYINSGFDDEDSDCSFYLDDEEGQFLLFEQQSQTLAVTEDGNSKLVTCTYEEYANEITLKGYCDKFAVTEETFKVPTILDKDNTKTYVVVANGTINQSDMDWSAWQSGLNAKQEKLIAGENITIVDNVISASGGATIEVSEVDNLTKENDVLKAFTEAGKGAITTQYARLLDLPSGEWKSLLTDTGVLILYKGSVSYRTTDGISFQQVYLPSSPTVLSKNYETNTIYGATPSSAGMWMFSKDDGLTWTYTSEPTLSGYLWDNVIVRNNGSKKTGWNSAMAFTRSNSSSRNFANYSSSANRFEMNNNSKKQINYTTSLNYDYWCANTSGEVFKTSGSSTFTFYIDTKAGLTCIKNCNNNIFCGFSDGTIAELIGYVEGWTYHTVAEGETVTDIKYNNGVYYVVTDNSNYYTSTDLTNWTKFNDVNSFGGTLEFTRFGVVQVTEKPVLIPSRKRIENFLLDVQDLTDYDKICGEGLKWEDGQVKLDIVKDIPLRISQGRLNLNNIDKMYFSDEIKKLLISANFYIDFCPADDYDGWLWSNNEDGYWYGEMWASKSVLWICTADGYVYDPLSWGWELYPLKYDVIRVVYDEWGGTCTGEIIGNLAQLKELFNS